MQILRHVTSIVNSRQARTNMEIHVCKEAVLRVMGPHPHRAGLAVLNLNVHIAQRGMRKSPGFASGGAVFSSCPAPRNLLPFSGRSPAKKIM